MVLSGQSSSVVLADFPDWLIHGILLGMLAAVAVFIVFLLGSRRFGDGRPSSSDYDPDQLRRVEVRAYLSAIGEPASEEVTIEGIPVDFWLPERSVAITFDADVYFRLLDADLTAVLLEHELPGNQLGARLPFETPSIRRSRSGDRDDRSWAHDILDVSNSADATAIERAYREKIKEVHPDVGGDQEALIEVLEAYDMLTESKEPS